MGKRLYKYSQDERLRAVDSMMELIRRHKAPGSLVFLTEAVYEMFLMATEYPDLLLLARRVACESLDPALRTAAEEAILAAEARAKVTRRAMRYGLEFENEE